MHFSLNGVEFGDDRSDLLVQEFEPGGPEIRTDDLDRPGSDGLLPGIDRLGGATWTWDILTNGCTAREGMAAAERHAVAWRPVGNPGEYQRLDFELDQLDGDGNLRTHEVPGEVVRTNLWTNPSFETVGATVDTIYTNRARNPISNGTQTAEPLLSATTSNWGGTTPARSYIANDVTAPSGASFVVRRTAIGPAWTPTAGDCMHAGSPGNPNVVAATPGQAMSIGVFVRPSHTVILRIGAQGLQTDGTGAAQVSGPVTTCPANVWTRLVFEGTVSTNTALTHVRPDIDWANGNNELPTGFTLDHDGLLIVDGPKLPLYFDGNKRPELSQNLYPRLTASNSGWAGTNNTSTGNVTVPSNYALSGFAGRSTYMTRPNLSSGDVRPNWASITRPEFQGVPITVAYTVRTSHYIDLGAPSSGATGDFVAGSSVSSRNQTVGPDLPVRVWMTITRTPGATATNWGHCSVSNLPEGGWHEVYDVEVYYGPYRHDPHFNAGALGRVRHNRLPDPFAAQQWPLTSRSPWSNDRHFGTGGSGTYERASGAGLVLNDGATVDTFIRKRWDVAPASSNGDTGINVHPLDLIPCHPGETYTLSGYVRTTSTANKTVRARVSFRDRTQTTVGAMVDGPNQVITAANGWVRISVTTVVPEGAATIRPVLDVISGGPLWVAGEEFHATAAILERTDVVTENFETVVPRDNLAPAWHGPDNTDGSRQVLVDPDFFLNWSTPASAGTNSESRLRATRALATSPEASTSRAFAISSTRWSNSGQRSVRIIPLDAPVNGAQRQTGIGNTGTNVGNFGPLFPGRRYRISATGKMIDGTGRLRVQAQWNSVAGWTGATTAFADSPSTLDTHRVVAFFDVPDWAVWTVVRIGGTATSQTASDGACYIDDVVVEDVTDSTPVDDSYFDGSTQGGFYSWTGTPNNSTSELRESVTVLDGPDSCVFGRPRRWAGPQPGAWLRQGAGRITCEFEVMDPRVFTVKENETLVRLAQSSYALLKFPTAPPFTWRSDGQPRSNAVVVGGTVPTSPTVAFKGPVKDPWAVIGGVRIDTNITLTYDQELRIDTLNRQVTLHTGGGAGIPAPGALTPKVRLGELTLPPGNHSVTFGGVDTNNSATATCVVRWRDARRGL